MTEVKDLDETILFVDLVVDENRGVDQLTHTRPLSNGVTHVGESNEQTDVI
jgi:hypothetical protein